MKIIKVSSNEANQRMDKLLIKYLNLAPKSFIYKMLRKKNITLNGKKADGSERLKIDDEIKLFLSEETIEKFSELNVKKVPYDLDIIYEDKNILIINKPSGLLSQKASLEDISLVEQMISYLLDTNQITHNELKSFKPGICNRLDRNTSGIIVAGKTLSALRTMAEIFRSRSIDKYYQCIVNGEIASKQHILGYLVKDEKTNKVTITKEKNSKGLYIQTEYEPLKVKHGYSLLNIKLITGRSHQIRGHLASVNHPVVGDYKYGNKKVNEYFKKNYKLDHQLLHSYKLVFPELEGEFSYLSKKEFTAKLPDIFAKIKNDIFV